MWPRQRGKGATLGRYICLTQDLLISSCQDVESNAVKPVTIRANRFDAAMGKGWTQRIKVVGSGLALSWKGHVTITDKDFLLTFRELGESIRNKRNTPLKWQYSAPS